MFFFLETIFSSFLLNINPFDQPAVEQGKVLTKKYLKMNKIRLLSDNTINQIAAGEDDRPSSAVKELIENSLDANSSKINIYVKMAERKK